MLNILLLQSLQREKQTCSKRSCSWCPSVPFGTCMVQVSGNNLLVLSACLATAIGNCKSWWARLSIPRRLAPIVDCSNGDSVNACNVAITIAVVIVVAAITSGPNKNGSKTTTPLSDTCLQYTTYTYHEIIINTKLWISYIWTTGRRKWCRENHHR